MATTTTTLVIQKSATISSNGTHFHGNCKAIVNLTTGEVYNSLCDAASVIGGTQSHVSQVCNGNLNTCKGMRLCFLSDIHAHFGELTERMRSLMEKADAYDAMVEAERQKRIEMKNETKKLEEKKQMMTALLEKVNAMQMDIAATEDNLAKLRSL